MSSEITTAFVKQFSSNVFHLSQQKGSRLRNAVRNESQVGKSAFYDRIGSTTAIKRLSRHSDTPQIDTPHSRRRVDLVDYEWGDLVDDADKIRLLIDPANEYAQAAMWAMGRAMDDEIIGAAFAQANGGEEGTTTVDHPDAQKKVSVASSAGSGLNLEALLRAKRVLDGNDVDGDIRRYIAHSAQGLEDLLNETNITSADFNSVRALVQGEVDTFVGLNFIRIERLLNDASGEDFDTGTGAYNPGMGGGTLTSSYKRNIVWAEDGLLLAIGMDMTARIAERADKSFSTQVYASMGIGSTRMEEDKVVELLSLEA